MPFHKKIFKEIGRFAGRVEREVRRTPRQVKLIKQFAGILEREVIRPTVKETKRGLRKFDEEVIRNPLVEEVKRFERSEFVKQARKVGATVAAFAIPGVGPVVGPAVGGALFSGSIQKALLPGQEPLPPFPTVHPRPTRIDPISEFQSRSLLQRRLQRGRAGSNPTGGRGIPFSAFDIRKASLLDSLG